MHKAYLVQKAFLVETDKDEISLVDARARMGGLYGSGVSKVG